MSESGNQNADREVLKELILVLWLELALKNRIRFKYEPDDYDGDRFIGCSPVGFPIPALIDDVDLYWEAISQLHNPTLDSNPWISLEYSINKDALQSVVDDAQSSPADWEEFEDKERILAFLNSSATSDLELREVFKDQATGHTLPGSACLVISVVPIENVLNSMLSACEWTWGTLESPRQFALANSLIQLEAAKVAESDLAYYLLGLIQLHPATPEEILALITLSVKG